MARLKRTRRVIHPQFYFQQRPSPPSSSVSSPPSDSSSTDHGSSSQEVQEYEVEEEREGGEGNKQEREQEENMQEEQEVEPKEHGSEDISVGVKRPFKDIAQDSKEVTRKGKKQKKELSKDHDQIEKDLDLLQLGPVTSDETEEGEDQKEVVLEDYEGDDEGGEDEGDDEDEGEDKEGKDEKKPPGKLFLQGIRYSSDCQFEFLNTMIEYRSKYLIYPFESQVAIDDFIKNSIKVEIPKWRFEMLMEQFKVTYLEETDDSDVGRLEPREPKVLEMVKKIFVTDNIGTEDIAKRFLERLTNDVNDQITFLMKIIQYLPTTPTVMPPVNGIPPIEDLIKNWLKVEVPKSELEKAILALRRKYIGTGSKGVKFTDLGKEDQNAIQLAEKIWGPVFVTHNTNDEDGRKSSTAPKG